MVPFNAITINHNHFRKKVFLEKVSRKDTVVPLNIFDKLLISFVQKKKTKNYNSMAIAIA